MGFYEDLVNGLKACFGEGRRFKNNAEMARFCGVQPTQTLRYTNGQREKHLRALGNILDALGARLVWPEQATFPREGASDRCAEYEKRIVELETANTKLRRELAEVTKEVRALEVYKHKWEGHLEAEAVRAQGSNLSMPIEKKLSA